MRLNYNGEDETVVLVGDNNAETDFLDTFYELRGANLEMVEENGNYTVNITKALWNQLCNELSPYLVNPDNLPDYEALTDIELGEVPEPYQLDITENAEDEIRRANNLRPW